MEIKLIQYRGTELSEIEEATPCPLNKYPRIWIN